MGRVIQVRPKNRLNLQVSNLGTTVNHTGTKPDQAGRRRLHTSGMARIVQTVPLSREGRFHQGCGKAQCIGQFLACEIGVRQCRHATTMP